MPLGYERLTDAARELNDLATAATARIRAVEEGLSPAAGVEVWVGAIGFAKVNGLWCIAFKWTPSSKSVALVGTDRLTRIRASHRLAELVEAVTDKMQEMLEEARKETMAYERKS